MSRHAVDQPMRYESDGAAVLKPLKFSVGEHVYWSDTDHEFEITQVHQSDKHGNSYSVRNVNPVSDSLRRGTVVHLAGQMQYPEWNLNKKN